MADLAGVKITTKRPPQQQTSESFENPAPVEYNPRRIRRSAMYTARILLVIAAALALVASQFAQQPASNTFAIEHVTVINVETGARSADQTVVVTGNRIASVA